MLTDDKLISNSVLVNRKSLRRHGFDQFAALRLTFLFQS